MHSVRACAKLNLGLQVLRRREDGFHDLATVFHPIGWADTISALPSERLTLSCSDESLPVDDSNLVMKAARRLARAHEVRQGAALHLEKVLPMGAGIGGGSSDAAATLRVLCAMWKLGYSRIRLQAIALELGSDVPFFLHGRVAYATGRGEILRPMPDYVMPYTLVIAAPPVHVSTAWAFGRISPANRGRPDLEAAVRSNDLERWRRELVNDFERPVMSAKPMIKDLHQHISDCGAGYVSLTGSGSAVFGAFESRIDAAAAREAAEQLGCRTWIEPAGRPVESGND